MAEPQDVNDKMIGTQIPPSDIEDSQDDTIADDGDEPHNDEYVSDEQAAPDHNYQDDDDDEENLAPEDMNGEEKLLAQEFPDEEALTHDFPMGSVESQEDIAQYSQDHEEDIRDSVENQLEPEPELTHEDIEAEGADQYQEYHEQGEAHIYDAQYEQPIDPEGHIHEAFQPPDEPEFAEAHMREDPDQHVRHEDPQAAFQDNDSSTLFVSERGSPTPDTLRRPGPFANTSAPMPPSTPPRQKMPGNSTFARIRNLQKYAQDKKLAASRKTTTYPIHSNPDNEAYLEAVMPGPSPSNAPAIDEDELVDRQARKEFAKTKRHYDELKEKSGGALSFKDDVEWLKIKGAESARKRKRERDLVKAQEDEEDEPDLFPEVHHARNNEEEEEEESDDPAFDFTEPGSRKRRRPMPKKSTKQMSMQDAELQSMLVALEADGDVPKKKRKGAAVNDDSEATDPPSRGKGKAKATNRPSKAKAAPKEVTKSSGGRGAAKKKKKQVIDHAVKQATSLFNSNVFQQQAGAGAAEQPGFRSRNKADALKELIASVPLDDQKKARGDMNTLLAATKDFDGKGSVKSDGKGLWIVKGMKTSLKGYQVLGTAFMRRRENAAEEPRGGLMADQMGLGKTLMMLANIVNGQPAKGAQGPRTTLLVASPALLTQWKNEIEQHTAGKMKIMRYGAGTRIDSTNAFEILGAHDIILTTYTEIMKSYPKNEPPIQCQTVDQKMAWWREVYDKQRGVLHRMMFLRIVLDEAQAIKNHMGRTSIACRALMAHHKWALSGTPILNSLTELYPYFKFLGVPHTGSFKIFKHNYCDSGDVENTERLLVRLSQFMIRRTHADEMFGAPILKLPQAAQSTYWCKFNSVERCIYDIVRNRFAKCINMWAKKGDLEKSYSNALVMLLRLRQLTAHVLMLQFVIRDLLEREDIELIRKVCEDLTQQTTNKDGQTIVAVRRQLDKLAADEKKKSAALEAKKAAARAADKEFKNDDLNDDDDLMDEDPDDAVDEDPERDYPNTSLGGSGGQFGDEYNFKPYLRSLKDGEKWERAKKKAKCGYCGKQPRDAMLTSCGHLICKKPCYEDVIMAAAEEEVVNPACQSCGVTPKFFHPCDAEDFDPLEVVAQGTRSQTLKNREKNKEKERKRLDREDIADDWLGACGDDVLPSAKTIAVKSQIMNWLKENPRVKIIIYTQFIAMIRILARICKKEGWKTEQYHGKMSLFARDKAITTFAEDPQSKIMLASLRCGGLGLNLTMASKVIMIDPWWNSASEQQAFCRVFRIGQVEETFMSRLCVRNTVDERLIEMQEKKQQEIASVMEDDGKTMKKMNTRELMRLFGNLEEDMDGRPFILVDNPDPRGGFRADRDHEGYADEF